MKNKWKNQITLKVTNLFDKTTSMCPVFRQSSHSNPDILLTWIILQNRWSKWASTVLTTTLYIKGWRNTWKASIICLFINWKGIKNQRAKLLLKVQCNDAIPPIKNCTNRNLACFEVIHYDKKLTGILREEYSGLIMKIENICKWDIIVIY